MNKVTMVKYGGALMAQSDFRCDVCGHEWQTKLSSVTRSKGCGKCAKLVEKTKGREL